MKPIGYERKYIYCFKGIRIRYSRRASKKVNHEYIQKDYIYDRAMKRGEKHLFKLYINKLINE